MNIFHQRWDLRNNILNWMLDVIKKITLFLKSQIFQRIMTMITLWLSITLLDQYVKFKPSWGGIEESGQTFNQTSIAFPNFPYQDNKSGRYYSKVNLIVIGVRGCICDREQYFLFFLQTYVKLQHTSYNI